MIGKSLAHYEVIDQIGKGGMGEVYRAKDSKLGRDVAIKILPEEFALEPDRVARFQREAKLLASLNHPNIAAIHGLEDSDGTHFLVMELIEGDTLADRIKAGAIPVEESLKLALQIAEALEAAHEKGVIHRDLKPSNIKITPEGKVKVLDFGLAKAYAGENAATDLSNSPTLSDAATRQGVILGTAAYMSPEQATGKSVDKRADTWAFGIVLFEMLTGKKLFEGETVTETIAGVIKGQPAWEFLPPSLHPRIQLLLERCLEKIPKNRYSGISDARVDIQKALADPSGLFVQPSPIIKPRKRVQFGLPLVASIAVLCIIIAALVVWMLKPVEPRKVIRFSYELPESQQFIPGVVQLAVSPDGDQFVYLTTDGLYMRSVDALDSRLITGTDQASRQPVFSTDGKWIAYWSQGERKLKKIAISGGVPVVLCDTGSAVLGLSWSLDNTIVYSDVYGGGVKRVSADGGTPESLIEAELAKITTDGIPTAPQILPDGKTILFTNVFSAANMADRQITVQSLESGEREVLVGGLDARYLSSGHLVYTQVNDNVRSLVAVPFDLDVLEVKSGPVPLLESIIAGVLSDSGTLVYVPGTSGSGSASLRTLVWVDKKGDEEPLGAPPNDYGFPKISPDGTRVALTVRGENIDIKIWDTLRKTLTRLTFNEANDIQSIWTPDSERIVFGSSRDGALFSLYWKEADGTGVTEKLFSMENRGLLPWSWSSDGKTLIVLETDLGSVWDIGTVSMEGDRQRKPLLVEEPAELNPRISPDGRFMAYGSLESGQQEIYIRPFPDVDEGKWQVSTAGGNSPLWAPDGKELFYLTDENVVMTVAVETQPTLILGTPEELFRGSFVSGVGEGHPWDIHPEGDRFLMLKAPGSDVSGGGPRKMNIVLNWDEELKQRVPVD